MQELQTTTHDLTLQKSIIEVIEDFTDSFNAQKTKNRYKTVLLEFFWTLNIIKLEELGEIHITGIAKKFEGYRKQKSKFDSENTILLLNPATINNIAYVIRSFFKYLIIYYNYPKNPLASFKPLKTKEHSTTDSLDRNELLDILKQSKMDYLDILYKSKNPKKHLTKLRNYLIFGFLSLSLRRDEIVNIKWDDLQEDSFFLIRQKWGSYKYIPVPSWLLDFLLKYRDEKTKNDFLSHYVFTPFINNYSWNLTKPISADYIMEITQKMCDRLNIV